jgi:hypothetical protein
MPVEVEITVEKERRIFLFKFLIDSFKYKMRYSDTSIKLIDHWYLLRDAMLKSEEYNLYFCNIDGKHEMFINTKNGITTFGLDIGSKDDPDFTLEVPNDEVVSCIEKIIASFN